MENKKSWLKLNEIEITPDIHIRIPTVGEILDNEKGYYSFTSTLTASPFSYMVQLDDKGIDYTTINEWQLFKMLFLSYSAQVENVKKQIEMLQEEKKYTPTSSFDYLSYERQISYLNNFIDDLGVKSVFGNFQIEGFTEEYDESIQEEVLFNKNTDVVIDHFVYSNIADTIRKINSYDRVKSKPGNESARKYLLEKERKRQKRNAKKPYEPYLEKIVIALVNTPEFPYDYDSCMDLSIYKFNQSFKQIQHRINFDKTMIGVYTGTIDTSKMANKDCLSWIQFK